MFVVFGLSSLIGAWFCCMLFADCCLLFVVCVVSCFCQLRCSLFVRRVSRVVRHLCANFCVLFVRCAVFVDG